nr:phenoloxidase-activating factor 2-like [Megalopta genalis]
MWKALLTLALASYCLAAPQGQQRDKLLDEPILRMLVQNPNPNPKSNPIPNPIPKPNPQQPNPGNKDTTGSADFGNLVALLNQYQNQQSTSTPSTFVGTQNKPKPPPDDCECVSYYLCRNGTVVEDGFGLIDIRSDFDVNSEQIASGSCDDHLEVCCKPSDKLRLGHEFIPPRIERHGCGQRNPDGVGLRITGGKDNESKFGEFPWMVAIMLDTDIDKPFKQSSSNMRCGGSLIHRLAVLTAAQCVRGKNASSLIIRAGEWDRRARNETIGHQDRKVQKVILHDKFYDFAILILAEPVDLAENVDVVCLPEPNTVFDASRCFVSGWGRDTLDYPIHFPAILKKVELPVVPRSTCEESIRNTLGRHFNLHESFICAGGEPGRDACTGDSGSPLVCPSKKDPTIYQQAGIVAWGIGCGERGIPGIYANVAYARTWIDDQMARHNLDNNLYNI